MGELIPIAFKDRHLCYETKVCVWCSKSSCKGMPVFFMSPPMLYVLLWIEKVEKVEFDLFVGGSVDTNKQVTRKRLKKGRVKRFLKLVVILMMTQFFINV